MLTIAQLQPSDQRQSLEETQPIDSMLSTLRLRHDIALPATKSELCETKINELESCKRDSAALFGDSSLHTREPAESRIALAKKDVVQCQCGCDEEEAWDDMVRPHSIDFRNAYRTNGLWINCHFCDTWQHLHCYGYRGTDDPRIPTIHACYKCLLAEKEAPLLRDLHGLALLRRGVHVLEVEGYNKDTTFAGLLRVCSAPEDCTR